MNFNSKRIIEEYTNYFLKYITKLNCVNNTIVILGFGSWLSIVVNAFMLS